MDPTQTTHDDFPIFRPSLGGGRRPSSRSGAGSLRNAVLAAARRGAARARPRPLARSRLAMLPPAATARRVVVKAHVMRMRPGSAKAAALHLRYIERDGVERDGSKGVLYGADGPVRRETFEEPRLGEKHQFRIIVSPEDAGELDLADYVRRLMVRVQRDLRRKLEWAAVNHYDTPHPHAHLVIRGVDRDGRELRLERAYISNGMRWRAQELATEELGHRHEFEIRRSYAKEISQDRFTSLDRELERRAKDNRVEIRSKANIGRIDESTLLARLEHLEGLRFAERLSPNSWKLADGWRDYLRELGSRGDILQQIHRAIEGDPSRYHIVRRGQALEATAEGATQVVTGRVASKGLGDELKGSFYAVIETPNGAAYHVPLDSRGAEALSPGDIVSLATKPEPNVRPVDRQIAEMALAQGSVYAPERREGGAHPHEHRLRELAQLGLATSEAPGRWKISRNLLRELEQRGAQGPVRHRLLVHKQPLSLERQVAHPGPVWLDRVKIEGLAPYGFGADMRRAVERRRDALRQLGVQPEDPSRIPKLREVERKSMGREIAARSGHVFLPTTPDGFRGRLQVASSAPNGSSYVVVSDGSTFVLLRDTAALRAAHGKVVTLSRDAKGRLLVRPNEKDLGL